MRTDTATFAEYNVAPSKSPRFVVKIEYPSDALYVSSHDDIADVPATNIHGVLMEPSISSQKLNPDEGRAEIGAASFTIADINSIFSDAIRALYEGGTSLRDRTCKFYLGFEGMSFNDFVLVGTQIIKDAKYDKGSYRISCNDIQRAARKDVFDLAQTTLSQTAESTDTTINVGDTTGFTRVSHGASYSDAANSTVGYIKIKDEIIRYTGATLTSFTGCTRGVLGTTAARYVADGSTPASRREKITEYVYLELPGPKLAYALLTGVLQNDSPASILPTKWHLGISTSLVRLADFTGIGSDMWNTADDTKGIVLRFEGLTKTDGKAFIETEILRLMGLFMPVYNTGELGLRRMTRVLADASSVMTLDDTNSVSVGELEHDMESLYNAFQIQWNWNGKDYTRTTTYLDAASATKHGTAPTMELKFKGLYGGRHTDGMIYKLLDSIRDRYSAPPLRLTVECFHSLNQLEVGDVVRVKHAQVRDYTTTLSSIDRAFEIQSISVNHRTGNVSLQLFGSTSTAAIDSPTEPTTSLPDAYYTSEGTNLATIWTISSGVVSGGPYTLTGGTTLGASASIYYYNGDLTIPDGVTVNITGNVQLRIKGYFTLNGDIVGTGGGWAGVADDTTPTSRLTGNPGFVGNARGAGGLCRKIGSIEARYPATTVAQHASFPVLQLEVSGNTLLGLPSDLRGTGGGPGGKALFYSLLTANLTQNAAGGTGGAGGAGLAIISRGFGIGADGSINLSGAATTTPAGYTVTTNKFYPGAGASGGPGAFLLLMDGSLLSVPDLAGRVQLKNGDIAPATDVTVYVTETQYDSNGTEIYAATYDEGVTDQTDLSYSASRIQYIPAPETAVVDSTTIAPVTALTVTQGSSGYSLTFTAAPGTPSGTVFEVWQHTSSSPFSSATKVAEGVTNNFFIPRNITSAAYVWVRARYQPPVGAAVYSTTTPATFGTLAQAASTAGQYASAVPTYITASAANSSITTGSTTASLVGGTAVSYSWARTSGSTSISVTSASAATTTFSATGVGAGVTVSAVFRCTITNNASPTGTYTVDVNVSCTNTTSSLSASASPTSLTTSGTAASQTTASTTVTASGGTSSYTYSWAKISGGTITANSTTSATTTFTASTLGSPETRNATFRCTVTDSASPQATATADVTVQISRTGSLSVSLAGSIDKTGSTSTLTTSSVTATASGGTSPYTYSWAKLSGGSITATLPSSSTTAFQATGMASGEFRDADYRVTVRDSASPQSVATADIYVSIERF